MDEIVSTPGKPAARWWKPCVIIAVGIGVFAAGEFNLLNAYVLLVAGYLGINIILATSLNLVNGYMGEFSIGHAGFMAVGAYVSSLLTVRLFSVDAGPFIFPLAVFAGGMAAAVAGLVVAIPSFKTRGDYLALVTFAFLMIVKSLIENIDAIGGPNGFLGMRKLSSPWWIYAWTVLCVWTVRNFVHSAYGRGVLAIREDEVAAELAMVNTRRVKIMAFAISAFFAGVAGALFAHLLQVINPRSFDIVRSTDILIMVYLGGAGSIAGSIAGASVFTLLMECLSDLAEWRMVIMPLALVLIMLFRPRGIIGMREPRWLVPASERNKTAGQPGKEATHAAS